MDCVCCTSNLLEIFYSLKDQPLAFPVAKNDDSIKFPLKAYYCKNCFHIQLGKFVDRSYFFNYSWHRDFIRSDYLKNFAIDLKRRIGKARPKILHINCNDGTLLSHLRKLNCFVAGIEPCPNLKANLNDKNIKFLPETWSKGISKKMIKFDVVIGSLSQTDDPLGYIEECKRAIVSGGFIVLELPYSVSILTNLGFDRIYHENFSYFSVNSLKTLVERARLSIVDLSVQGESIRVYLREKGYSNFEEIILKEEELGVYEGGIYEAFAPRCQRNLRELRLLMAELRISGDKIVGYGASNRGISFLNYFAIDLDYVVDDNKIKQGFYTAGRKILISSPLNLKEEEKFSVVLLARNYYEDISRKLRWNLGFNPKLILYTPLVRTREIQDVDV